MTGNRKRLVYSLHTFVKIAELVNVDVFALKCHFLELKMPLLNGKTDVVFVSCLITPLMFSFRYLTAYVS